MSNWALGNALIFSARLAYLGRHCAGKFFQARQPPRGCAGYFRNPAGKTGISPIFAGGCVRDELLGLEPKDYDVATDAPPQRVRQIFPHSQAVGAAFGVILVHEGPSVIEVATFRSDLSYRRRPQARGG